MKYYLEYEVLATLIFKKINAMAKKINSLKHPSSPHWDFSVTIPHTVRAPHWETLPQPLRGIQGLGNLNFKVTTPPANS